MSSVLIAILDEKYNDNCLSLAMKFRDNNINTEVYLNSGKLDRQIKYADKLGIPFVVLVGEDEIRDNKLSLKNMKTGQQVISSTDEAIKIIKDEQQIK